MTIAPLKVGYLHACCQTSAGNALMHDEPNKRDKAIEQDQLDWVYVTSGHSNALGLMGSVQELPLVRLALLFSQLGIRSHT